MEGEQKETLMLHGFSAFLTLNPLGILVGFFERIVSPVFKT
jgi:hypothetical protein